LAIARGNLRFVTINNLMILAFRVLGFRPLVEGGKRKYKCIVGLRLGKEAHLILDVL
jgi:hypothetical protein